MIAMKWIFMIIGVLAALAVLSILFQIDDLISNYNKVYEREKITPQKRIDEIQKYINALQKLPPEERAQVDPAEVERKQAELTSLLDTSGKTIALADIEMTERVLKLIDEVIVTEVHKSCREHMSLNQRIPADKLDDKLRTITESILKGLDTRIYDTSTLFNRNFLIQYISDKAYISLFNFVANYNADHDAAAM